MIDGGDGAPEPGYVSMMCRDGTGTPFRPVRIAGARVRIGRRAENDLIISNPSVSRQHAEIFAEAGRWFIVDNDSKFGTYVNGERVVRAPVTPGDEIRLGGEDGPLIVFGATGDEAVEDGPLVDTVEPPTTGRGEMPIVAGGVPASSDAAMGLVEQFRATSLLGDYRQALSTVVDAALRLTQFDCAALCLADANTTATPDVRVDVWRTRMDAGTLNTDRVTRIVVDTVASAVMLVSSCDDDAAKDRDERARPAVEAGMRQVVCIPIVTAYDVPLVAPGGARATTIGALYLEESSGAPSVTGHIVDVLASLANEAGAVLERSNASQRDIALAREQLALVASENAVRANDASLPMSERARAACALAEFQQLIGDIDGALAALEAFFETSARAKLPEVERARVLKTIGVTHMWRAKWHVAVGMLNAALDALASATDVALEMETLAMLARCYSEIGELELGAQAKIARERNAELRGRTVPVLVCGFDERGRAWGRTQGQAPDIDGITYLRGPRSGRNGAGRDESSAGVEIGEIVLARIVRTTTYDLEAAPVAEISADRALVQGIGAERFASSR